HTFGWVDVRHFGTAATDVCSGTPEVVEKALGFGVEVYQWSTEWGNSYRSGFSPEDIPSNAAGSDFGSMIEENPDRPVDSLFQTWAGNNGALSESNNAYQQARNALPATDPAVRGGQ